MDSIQKQVGEFVKKDATKNMLDSLDFNKDLLNRIFKEVDGSQEKLRAALNLLFIPRVKPTFDEDKEHADVGLGDVEFQADTESRPSRDPYRMFDIDTGNLVEFPAIGHRGQYSMLSHRWIGQEITLGDIKEARRKEMERTREAAKKGEPVSSQAKKSDIDLVLEQCKLDIEEQKGVILELASACGQGGEDIDRLLGRFYDARAAESGLEWARDKEAQAKSKLKFAEMERRNISNLVRNGRKHDKENGSDGTGTENGPGGDDPPQSPPQSHVDNVGVEIIQEANAELQKAQEELRDAKERYEAARKDIEYFQRHRPLRDALEEMVVRLEKRKSAIKLSKAIQEAARIFNTEPFPRREKRYLWSDTCCIDKTNSGELTESLSLMGDWYGAADFTLVKLDKPAYLSRPFLKGETKGAPENKKIERFKDIRVYKPEWSERAWTLQELVMSRMTFYANPEWISLSRPVENLGYFYYLIPFISLYIKGDTGNIYRLSAAETRGKDREFLSLEDLEELLSDFKVLDTALSSVQPQQDDAADDDESGERAKIRKAHHLIRLLTALGVEIPGNLTRETAISGVARAVFLAADDLAGDASGYQNRRELLASLQKKLPRLGQNASEREEKEKLAQQAINFVLMRLVDEAEELIVKDREYIAEFGRVQQLSSWQKGTSRTGFAASSILELSGRRNATVETDRAYSLMGILGVRFPTFPAEGYPKALARLLDEVIIARNDVSVFNWTGTDMGSPVRGRSLYPSSHTAYGNREDRGRRYNLSLSEQARGEMDRVLETYRSIVRTLQGAIRLLKNEKRNDLPLHWIERIVQRIEDRPFEELRPHHEAFAKIIRYIVEHYEEERKRPTPEKDGRDEEAKADPETPPEKGLLSRISSGSSFPGFKGPSLSSSKKDKEDKSSSATKKKVSSSSLVKSVKKPSFSGLTKKGGGPAQLEREEELANVDAASDPPPPYPGTETPAVATAQSSWWQALNGEVMEYLNSSKPHLPTEIQSVEIQLDDKDGKDRRRSAAVAVAEKRQSSEERKRVEENNSIGNNNGGNERDNNDKYKDGDEDFISPNPIVVTNAGIEGIFDVQRVVVTMFEPDRLRRRIERAAGPRDIITGWCAVSTGFARVVTSFACEQRVLKRQLEVVESVEARVLSRKLDDDDNGKKSGTTEVQRTLSNVFFSRNVKKKEEVTATTTATVHNGGNGGREAEEKEEEKEEEEKREEEKKDDEESNDNREQEQRVHRMIEFVQEPRLDLVAGEWVLARFSGTPGARWFLCQLELGPAPGVFHGRRIPSGTIDFGDGSAAPEPGLVRAWGAYMDRKRRKLCYIVNEYLESITTAQEGERKLQETANFALQGFDIAAKGLGLGPETNPTAAVEAGQSEGRRRKSDESKVNGDGRSDHASDDDDDGNESEEDLLGRVLDHTKRAGRALKEYTILTVAHKLMEMHADHLDKTLATAVLKRTPKNLWSAMVSMDDNGSFLPAMYHSSTRIHMF